MEELGLWGYNTLLVWLDMSHFKSFDDPEAVTFRRRLHAICEAAAGIGLDVGFMVIANEGYNTSPAELRALNKNGAQRGGWYDCQVCPSKPEGMKYIIGAFRQLLDWWSDLHPAYVCICAYDQGGCGCDLCRPWGTNGFPRTAKKLVALARRQLPEVKVIVSTWQFDVEEWRSLSREFSEKAPWADYVLAEGIVQPMSRGLPIVGFPEISMYNMRPWGGFGATPVAQPLPITMECRQGPRLRRISLFRRHIRGHQQDTVQPVLLERPPRPRDPARIHMLGVFARRGGRSSRGNYDS